jgi:putative glycosyltransferase (TIGR04372 family)
LPGILFSYVILTIVSKFITIKIGRLGKTGKESLLISYIEPYLRSIEQSSGWSTILVIIDPAPLHANNKQLIEMYRRKVIIIDRQNEYLMNSLFILYGLLSDNNPMKILLYSRCRNIKKHRDLWSNYNTVISFTEDEKVKGDRGLKKIGLMNGKYFCFGLREDSYFQQIYSRSKFSYIDNWEAGPDSWVRNPSLNTYVKLAENFTSDDLKAVRMGKYSTEKVVTDNPNIIDHATSGFRSDFIDTYMIENCKFLINGASGIFFFASLFNKPVLMSDVYLLSAGVLNMSDIFTPSLLWDKKNKKLLKFEEMLELGMLKTTYLRSLQDEGLEIVHNSEDELIESTNELISIIDGVKQFDDKDEYLNKKFKNIIANMPGNDSGFTTKMSAHFIKKYERLL